MARHRFLIALVPHGELLTQVRGLRLLVGSPAEERIVPHVTIVAPFNLAADGVGELRRHLRGVAARTAPFDLALGPASTFAPGTPTLHLEVHGDGSVQRLHEQLNAVLGRPERRVFVPHLTIARRVEEARSAHAALVLPGRLPEWRVDAVTLLVQHSDGAATRWLPVAEEPFGGPVVVGRGGVELHLRSVSIIERGGARPARTPEVPAGATPLVTSAEPPGEPGTILGTVHGHVAGELARLSGVEVDSPQRGRGVGRQLVERWMNDAGRAGARLVVAAPTKPGFLLALGFGATGAHLVRSIPGT